MDCIHIILNFNEESIDKLLNLIYHLTYIFYKILNTIFLNIFFYIGRFLMINIVYFINTILAKNLLLKIISIKNTIRDFLVHYNTRIFKWRKRYALYCRFGKLKNVKLLFYITFFIILVYIWQNRNLYRYNFPIKYYFYYFISFMLLSIFLYGIIDNWIISEILALFISFFFIILTLK